MMKKTAIIFFFLLHIVCVQAQVNFTTIAPQQAVISGESFQVQYIIEGGDKSINVNAPVFNNFRFVAGPKVYLGSVSTFKIVRPVYNNVYTLEALKPGRYTIQGATIKVNGTIIRSNNVVVQVISKKDAVTISRKENSINSSEYFLRPEEDPYKKIKQNLFIKVLVDKKNCLVGEPVLATFKLYSRLESKSDIIKNPGFYGFTIYDMVSLNDKQMATENINGKMFDVHIIRKVQLYPLQAGMFTIDAMQVKNKVEFSKSKVSKKTEQEIVEGLLGNNEDKDLPEETEIFETDISTEPLPINVKPLPEKNKPDSFAGAVGHFIITTALTNDKLAKNEQGFLEVTISGKGNFTQLDAPTVRWPAGVESFQTVVKDSLDKTKIPLMGNRIFRYPFVCSSPGMLVLPGVSFSFFDTDSNNYKTISTKTVKIKVSNEIRKEKPEEQHKSSIAKESEKAARKALLIVVLLALMVVMYWIFRKKEPEKLTQFQGESEAISIENLLKPANVVVTDDSKKFYSTLYSIIWKITGEYFELAGSEMNKQLLAKKMDEAKIDNIASGKLFQILEKCETGMFTNAILSHDKQAMLSEVKEVLEKIREGLL